MLSFTARMPVLMAKHCSFLSWLCLLSAQVEDEKIVVSLCLKGR